MSKKALILFWKSFLKTICHNHHKLPMKNSKWIFFSLRREPIGRAINDTVKRLQNNNGYRQKSKFQKSNQTVFNSKNHESFAEILIRLYWPSFTREFDLSKIELGSEIILVCNKKCKNKRINKSLVSQYNLNNF